MNILETEWAAHSGETATFPEIDRSTWFDTATALQKINPAQAVLITQLMARM